MKGLIFRYFSLLLLFLVIGVNLFGSEDSKGNILVSDKENIESFIPMCYGMVMKGGKRVRRLVPAIHNLVFVHSTRKRIDALKDELEGTMPIRFIMNREHCRPVVIPDAQMRSFIW